MFTLSKKLFIKHLFIFVLICFGFFGFSFANQYLFFYGEGCSHCAEVEEYFEENNILENFNIEEKETRHNLANAKIFSEYIKQLNIPANQTGVPFLVIINEDGTLDNKMGDTPIINYFSELLNKKKTTNTQNNTLTVGENEEQESIGEENTQKGIEKNKQSIFSLLITLFTTSLADSINPCVFAVMLLLLSTILTRSKSRKKAVLAGLMFVLAIFLGYAFLGRLLLSVLTSVGIGVGTTGYWIQIIVGIIGIFIGLANLKDYFFPDVFPPMEVPLSRRPQMHKIVKGVLSPVGAFGIGLILTMFLLPCTAGPYVVFTTTLSAYPEIVNNEFMLYFYLFIYNIIFIIPMLIIVGIIGFGFKSVEELGNLRKKNRLLIHLIVGLLMLGLGIYILTTAL